MTKKKNIQPDLWDTPSEYVENLAAPAVKNRARKQQLMRRSLLTVAFGGVPLMLLVGFASLTPPEAALTTSSDSVSVNDSRGKSAAITAMNAWIGAEPRPLPGGRLISWDGYETLAPELTANDKLKLTDVTYQVEIHRFTVATGSGDKTAFFESSVEVLVDDVLGAKATGFPSLLPVLPSSTNAWPSETLWLNYPSSSAPKPVASAVNAWAVAYASGSPDALRLAVGDPSSEHSYLPLSGVSTATATVIGAAPVPVSGKGAVPTQMLVRVSLAVTWAGQAEVDGQLPEIAYDLLIDGADTAAPRVVSWGGAGSAPKLTPYSTAFDGADIVLAAPTDTDEPTTKD